MKRAVAFLALTIAGALPYRAVAAELTVPKQVKAGTEFSIPTSGGGEATFYLLGPGRASKRQVQLGSAIAIPEDEVRIAGHYVATLCGAGCDSADFYVTAGEPADVSFLVHPSRVPVARNEAISAVAFVFDKFHNLVVQPTKVSFGIAEQGAGTTTRPVNTSNGVAWMRMPSTKKGGPVKVLAAMGQATEIRVVQQVPSDACNLRIKAARSGRFISVETDPVRDCSGNPVPDGTVVSFTKVDASGKTTVDAPIKRGVAKAQMPASGSATISVASGVAIGNELRIGGTP